MQLPLLELKLSKKAGPGFSLIEILVAIAIVSLLLILAIASFRIFSRQVDLNTTSQQIISSLQLARNQTLASEDEAVYGVHFETSQYVLFKGATYDSTSADNKEFNLSGVEIYEINLAGGDDVVFERIRGTTQNNGDIRLRLTAEASRTQTILINPLGQASLEETVTTSPGARVTDTRHLHFNLGWSIQNSVTLTLTFSDPPNPDVVDNVAMASYFNATKTEFDWEDTVDVNGSNQTIRVHTHSLDATNTLLSIHRDGQKNDKAVIISIDGRDIVSYAAEGTSTVLGFGGTMSVQ